ncbi:unnamed protein product [Heligmosomoides polygyrus]|uniref:Peptidase A2 domain-containing protein n=1 Tax=Heligmosomoides polygyrus TaxID=6339 RepID=A0A183GSX8_HELPZ|nr:unnamed protein product [Heligmosomoides polygyrus]
MGCEPSKGALFGEKSVYPVKMMGLDLTALLDTGSEASIVPLGVFKRAREKKVDVDAHVKRIPGVNAIVRNASGEVMKFVDTIRMDVTLDGETRSVGFHVGDGLDNLVLLGTNALAAFGITLGKVRPLETTETVEACNNIVAIQSSQTSESDEVSSGSQSGEVRVQERVFIPPGYVKFVPLAVDITKEEVLFESSNEAFSRGICRVSAEGTIELPVANVGTEPMTFRKGDIVGAWQSKEYIPQSADDYADMLESGATEARDDPHRRRSTCQAARQSTTVHSVCSIRVPADVTKTATKIRTTARYVKRRLVLLCP